MVASQDRKFRISITGVESQTQMDLGGGMVSVRKSKLSRGQDKFLKKELKRAAKNPEYAGMLDIDSFVESPKDIEAKDFITESLKQIKEKVPVAFK